MKLHIMLAILLSTFAATAWAQEDQVVKTFLSHGRTCQVAFIPSGKAGRPWPDDLVLRWRTLADSGKWHIVSRIVSVRLEKSVTLQSRNGSDIDALVVSYPGGSAQLVSVIEIAKDHPKLRVLLDRELDKGFFDYRYDSEGRLAGFVFHYCAWHVAPDNFALKGHIFTARNIAWLPSEREFRHGAVYVDTDAEEKARLLDVLFEPGSEVYLPITYQHNNSEDTAVVIYRPIGLLRRKTPPELRSASEVRVVVKLGPSPEYERWISEIAAVNTR